MKKLTTTMLAAGVMASALAANAVILATEVEGSLDKINYKSKVWNNKEFAKITLYPQTTIEFNDKKANELNAGNKAIEAEVAAVYNNSRIAFLIKWPDGTKNIQKGYATDVYSDGFAIQFASDYSKPTQLPYIGMGSEGRPVVIHLQKEAFGIYEPNGEGDVAQQVNPNQTNLFGKDLAKFNKDVKKLGSNDYERSFVSEGFRSMTEIKDGSNKSYSRIGYAAKGWEGTLSRPLKDEYVDLDAGVIPVAFAVWDGAKMGRNGLKYLTPWLAVELDGKSDGEALLKALMKKPKGDVQKGKEIAAANCTACHQLTPSDAPNLMGPSLTNIGGYATVDYIKESLVKPSAVVVPGYNRNAHSNYAWYNLENGKRVSAMPDFSWMEASDIDDITAYLKSLKAEVE